MKTEWQLFTGVSKKTIVAVFKGHSVQDEITELLFMQSCE